DRRAAGERRGAGSCSRRGSRRHREERLGTAARRGPGGGGEICRQGRGGRTLTLNLRVRLSFFRRLFRVFAPQSAEFSAEVVDCLLDVLQPLRKGPQTALESFDVGRRGQIEGAHRRLLGLESLLPGAQGGSDGVVQGRVVDQRL